MSKTTSTIPRVISAVCTPLQNDESLHIEALEAHLERQWRAGIHGLLVAGSMGDMQLLTDRTYAQLIEHAVRISAGRGEVMIGVGDTSQVRTLERIRLVNKYPVAAAVVITPYFSAFRPAELVDYYWALADASWHPLYLYDLPCVTGVKLDCDTVERVAEHPNIYGIKASCEVDWSKELIRRIGDRFRVIVAQVRIMDSLLRDGICEHLDGIVSLAPAWTMALLNAAQSGDWDRAAAYQRRMNELLDVLIPMDVFPGITAIFNEWGIPGKIGAAPLRQLDADARRKLLAVPIVQKLLREDS